MDNAWLTPGFADAYAKKDDPKDWYEREVNIPAMVSLLPTGRVRILDFGCGAGDVTAELGKNHDAEGSDISPRMVELARAAHPEIPFNIWDGVSPYPDAKTFDVVFSKLVFMFIDDLNVLATQVKEVLDPRGSLVFSVAHPMRTAQKVNDYFADAAYDTQIGGSGIRTTMIHRSFEAYIRPFTDRGFALTALLEPGISVAQSKRYNASADDLIAPKRLVAKLTRI